MGVEKHREEPTPIGDPLFFLFFFPVPRRTVVLQTELNLVFRNSNIHRSPSVILEDRVVLSFTRPGCRDDLTPMSGLTLFVVSFVVVVVGL